VRDREQCHGRRLDRLHRPHCRRPSRARGYPPYHGGNRISSRRVAPPGLAISAAEALASVEAVPAAPHRVDEWCSLAARLFQLVAQLGYQVVDFIARMIRLSPDGGEELAVAA